MIQFDKYLPLKQLLEWNIEFDLNLSTKSLKKGEFLLKAGQPCDYLYFIMTGFIRTYYYDINGNDMTHIFAMKNSITTSPFSFLLKEENILYLQALEDTELVLITYEQLNHIIQKVPSSGESIRNIYMEFGMLMSRRIMSIHTETAETRYLNLIKNYPYIFQQAKLSHIASYLGITIQSLSRIRKQINA
jgi:CRP-like cAMP-binding protein